MTRRAYLYFVVTFLLGAIVGATAIFYYGWRTGLWHRPFNRQVFINHVKRELSLSSSQVDQLQQIVDETGRKVADARQQNEAQLDAIRKESRGRIRQILSPEQIQKFDEITQRMDARRLRVPH
jgi:hypothetical protein